MKKFRNDNFPFNHRRWTPDIKYEKSDNVLRIISYNILCNSLISTSTMIDNEICKSDPYLKWDNRKKVILEEIMEIKADIVCIQEFEKDSEFIKIMSDNFFDCAFKKRTGDHPEGCAIFWNNNKFIIENVFALELNLGNKSFELSSIYTKDNICLYVILRSTIDPDKLFIIANCHILFNYNRGDIKLGQVYQIINGINKLKIEYEQICEEINIILCGDFNSVPNSAIYKLITEGILDCSEIDKKKISNQLQGDLNYINPSKLKPSLLNFVTSKFDTKKNSHKNTEDNKNWLEEIYSVELILDTKNSTLCLKKTEVDEILTNKLEIPFNFKSAYSQCVKNLLDYFSDNCPDHLSNLEIKINDYIDINAIKMSKREITKTLNFITNLTLEPPLTSYNKNVIATLDYIFYSGNIKVLKTLNIPDINILVKDMGPMPNKTYPSDHISMVVDFLI